MSFGRAAIHLVSRRRRRRRRRRVSRQQVMDDGQLTFRIGQKQKHRARLDSSKRPTDWAHDSPRRADG